MNIRNGSAKCALGLDVTAPPLRSTQLFVAAPSHITLASL
jgi:hypothetical protein